jgi:serine/threonine protein phosphatase PrpC
MYSTTAALKQISKENLKLQLILTQVSYHSLYYITLSLSITGCDVIQFVAAINVMPGDVVVLASDGLFDNLDIG